jgi:hypothetical protein
MFRKIAILMLMSAFSVILLSSAITVLADENENRKEAEQIIDTFINEKGLGIQKNTKEYQELMKSILLGDYPELTGEGSKYISGQQDLDLILEYATKQMGPQFKDYPVESEIQEAISAIDGADSEKSSKSTQSYNRTNAINYAYTWWNGQNPNYPDFGGDDCTNFISQSMIAGGFSMLGTGDGCRHESTQTEWYVNANSSWSCWGSNSNWEWSTAWSVVYDFRRYFTFHNSYATTLGWTTSHTTAKNMLSPGDIVQLQSLHNGNWISYHNMLVTDENISSLLVTYRSADNINKPLSNIPAGSTQRYLLIRFP